MSELQSNDEELARCDDSLVHRYISYKNYVNLGCGEIFHPDWLNIDLFPKGEDILLRDLRMGFPLPVSSIDLIYSSYFFHLLNESDAYLFLNQCFRCLRPGGIIRLVVPDEEIAAEKYLENIRQLKNESLRPITKKDFTPIFVDKIPLQRFAPIRVLRQLREVSIRMVLTKKQYAQLQYGRKETSLFGVKAKYHVYSLTELLRRHGFENFIRCSPNESSVANWANFGLDVDENGRPRHKDSLYLEARKPLN